MIVCVTCLVYFSLNTLWTSKMFGKHCAEFLSVSVM